MAKFNDRRPGKGEVDLGAQALADAQRDSVGAYGRVHAKSMAKQGSDSVEVAEHHSGDVFKTLCSDCQSDAKAGNHPRA